MVLGPGKHLTVAALGLAGLVWVATRCSGQPGICLIPVLIDGVTEETLSVSRVRPWNGNDFRVLDRVVFFKLDNLPYRVLELTGPSGVPKSVPLQAGRHFVVVLPEIWTVQRGQFSGVKVPTPGLFSQDGLTPTVLREDIPLWREWPLRIGFREGPFSPQGTLEALRSAAALVNELAGTTLFTISDTESSSGTTDILTIFEKPSLSDRLGSVRLHVDTCSHERRCMPRRVDSADVFLSPDSDSSVFIHELFHAGGLSHTCTVPSIMATEFSEQEIRRCISLRR